jgi:DNA-binding PadR family transcriptional regulator
MSSKAVLGETEHHVLLAAARLGAGAHTVAIVREIEARTGRAVAPAAVYIALRRLEGHRLVRSRLRTAPGDWRSRRHVEVTEAGRRMLKTSRERLLKLWDGLDPLWKAR